MRVDLFDFELPQESVALEPMQPRDKAKMLVVRDGAPLINAHVFDLPAQLMAGDVLVVNDTKVIPARLKGIRGQARVEITLHKREGLLKWRAFVKNSKRLKPGDQVFLGEGFSAEVLEKTDGGEVLFAFDPTSLTLEEALHKYGVMPLPPYIASQRGENSSDLSNYQTIYADKAGAVAAPTAGLHFTPALLDALASQRVESLKLTLHVGAGTFLPVKVDDTDHHIMHAEYGELDEDAAKKLNQARADGRRIVAVGTTSLRLLESAVDRDGVFHPFAGETDIFITPGYKFRAVDVLMTNFHLPRSTLFMLVSAFSGIETMKSAYQHAIRSDYRFYSYGDACLLFRKDD